MALPTSRSRLAWASSPQGTRHSRPGSASGSGSPRALQAPPPSVWARGARGPHHQRHGRSCRRRELHGRLPRALRQRVVPGPHCCGDHRGGPGGSAQGRHGSPERQRRPVRPSFPSLPPPVGRTADRVFLRPQSGLKPGSSLACLVGTWYLRPELFRHLQSQH